jgi:predicted Abi (CAAX) family protease
MSNSHAPVPRQPVAEWVGRLVFRAEDHGQDDEVLFEVYHAAQDHAYLVGQIVRLQWNLNASLKEYIQTVRRTVRFNETTKKSIAKGNVHPTRLDNLEVGPLESLAGARAEDDIEVMLCGPELRPDAGVHTVLAISREPIQVSGIFYSVVTIRKRISQAEDRFEVQHYSVDTHQFDGPLETVHIPQAVPDGFGIRRSTNQGIETSPANAEGWYIFGQENEHGVFVVKALEPYQALALKPDQVILNQQEGFKYIEHENWRATRENTGKLETVLVDPTGTDEETAVARWHEGDRFILIHLFGGISGEKRDEESFLGLVNGHFAYGTAKIVREPLTQALQFDIEYHQVYAHNVGGIISGTIKRFCYLGDLHRGWLGARPVSDIVVRMDAVTQDYEFGSITLSPFDEFVKQLTIMTARYRVGDGTGAALVSPARCCVQDSNQALYVALQRVEDEVRDNPEISAWLAVHPDEPETLRFRQLQALARELDNNLVPLGIVRRDWKRNANGISGFKSGSNLLLLVLRTIVSWRTMLPRRAHDEIAKILLAHGAQLWFIRTNQVGGKNPDVGPLAPTTLLSLDNLIGRVR